MDKSKQKYRNYKKTEVAIKNALIELYNEKHDINKVTVKELAERANISRSTFYLHYNDLISIFESVGDQFVESLKKMIVELSKSELNDFSPYIKKIFKLIDKSSELIKIGLSLEYPFYYIENLKNQLEDIIKNNPVLFHSSQGAEQTIIETRIVVSGVIDFMISIIRSKDKIDYDKYAVILNKFLVRWANTLI